MFSVHKITRDIGRVMKRALSSGDFTFLSYRDGADAGKTGASSAIQLGFKKSLHVAPGFNESYVRDVVRHDLLTREEEQDLALRVREGDEEALNKLVSANLRFAMKIAAEYFPFVRSFDGVLTEDDLVQAANMGLIEAARRFNGDMGVHFTTYAVTWIRRNVQNILDEARSHVRVPENRRRQKVALDRFINQYESLHGHAPSMEDIREALDDPNFDGELLLQIAPAGQSLHQPAGNGEGTTLMELVEDINSIDPGKMLEYAGSEEDLRTILEALSDIERTIILKYYGLLGHNRQKLVVLAEKFSLSAERIRQLREKALEKIRRHPLTVQLR